MADTDIRDFYNLTYLPVTDATNYRTRASSTNFFGGFAEINFNDQSAWENNQNLSDVGTMIYNNSRGFLSSNMTIKAGTYYFEYLQVPDGTNDYTGNNMDQGEVIYGFRRPSYYMYREAFKMILPFVLRFDQDTRLKTGSLGRFNRFSSLFITPYETTTSEIKDLNALKYVPSDERNDLSRATAAGWYTTLLTNDMRTIRNVVGTADSVGVITPSGTDYSDPDEYQAEIHDYGYYRTYSMIQRSDPLENIYNGVPIGAFSQVTPSIDRIRGYQSFPSVGYTVRSPVTNGAEVYGCWYGARVDDYNPYNPDTPNIYNTETFIPSHRKNVSRFIDRVATLDRTAVGGGVLDPFLQVKKISSVFNPVIGGLENWTWDTEASAIILTINFLDDNMKTVKLHHTDGAFKNNVFYFGATQPTVMIPTIGDSSKGFTLETLDGSSLGRFWMTAVFLP